MFAILSFRRSCGGAVFQSASGGGCWEGKHLYGVAEIAKFSRGLVAVIGLTFGTAVMAQNDARFADPKAPPDTQFAKQAEQAYQAARTQLLADSNNPEAAWEFARTSYDWADFAHNNSDRAEVAEAAIKISRRMLATKTNATVGRYYLAMNLGQLARTKTIGALKLVEEMETEFDAVLAADAKLDYAGADRNLGLLYLDSPGWPLSIGNKGKARQHLEAAVKLAPEYPENQINLIEAELKWGDKKGAVQQLKALAKLWPTAKTNFAGPKWESSWADWAKRRPAAEKKSGVKPEDPAGK
jgi:hypothetical protein